MNKFTIVKSKQTNTTFAMTQRSELTDAQKGTILALIPFLTHAEIAAQLDIPCLTVTNFILRAQQRNFIKNLTRPGRPRKLFNTAIRYRVHTAEANSHVSLKELANLTNIKASIRTTRCRLRELGIRKWRAVKRPFLTPKHAKQRLVWAKAHQQ